MQTMRESWTDERLDDLSKRVDDGFRRVDAELREVRVEIGALNRTLTAGFGGIAASVLAAAVAVILTHSL